MADMNHRQVAQAVVALGGVTVTELGLRFDRVAVRVLDRLQRSADAGPHAGASVALALTAPVRAPGKTAAALQREIGALLRTGHPGDDQSLDVHGARAELRLVVRHPRRENSLVGFVHNPDRDAATILALAER